MTTVLVVDDSPLDRKIAGGILQVENMSVSYASNGQEALDQMATEKPDVVLTDLQMPVMDGLELVRKTKEIYPSLPVILITRAGSEEIAVEALQAGASSYIPKRNMKRDLSRVLDTVLMATEKLREREQVRNLLKQTANQYILGYEVHQSKALINHVQESLIDVGAGNQADRLRISTALVEAITNAVDHGNLELDSKLREDEAMTYRTLGDQRSQEAPYRDRKVYVSVQVNQQEATFVIRDEGPGFDPQILPDPTDLENLTKPSGRGVMLIRTFMDEVKYNETGNELTMVKRIWSN